MTHLSEALQKHYVRQGNRIVFSNGQSLNKVALVLWEDLGGKAMDASVLSRVLSGKRLFTGVQLHAFCRLLDLSDHDRENLSECLRQDCNARFGLTQGEVTISSSFVRETILSLADQSVKLFYAGEYETVRSNYESIEQLVTMSQKNINFDIELTEAIGLGLYMYSRASYSNELPSLILNKVKPVFSQLIRMSNDAQSLLLFGYAHSLLADAYYGAGGYSNASAKSQYHALAIRHAKKAIDVLPADHHERLFAFRTMVASANYAGENDIAEAINSMQYNYHPTATTGENITPSGKWGNSWHVYGVYRDTKQIEVFYDGTLIGTLKTSDNGGPEPIFFTSGESNSCCGAPSVHGAAANVLVDWVREWN